MTYEQSEKINRYEIKIHCFIHIIFQKIQILPKIHKLFSYLKTECNMNRNIYSSSHSNTKSGSYGMFTDLQIYATFRLPVVRILFEGCNFQNSSFLGHIFPNYTMITLH